MLILPAVTAGLLLSLLISLLIPPFGPRGRLPGGYALLAGVSWWLIVFGGVCLISQRPLFSAAFVVVWHGVLVAVNHAKITALKEPFLLQDFEYFTDALRHPQLYVPFFGVIKTLALLLFGAIAIGLFLWLETPLYRTGDGWQGPVIALLAGTGLGLTAWVIRPRLTLNPVEDIQRTGLFGLFHSHLAEYWLARKRSLPSPAANWPTFQHGESRPHMVLVQSESFFDPRMAYPFVAPSVLSSWDRLRAQAAASGQLEVSAWGANTVRTEAGVLTGLSQAMLGIYQYNPYRRLRRHPVPSLASHLRAQGYKTVCIHPYPASFYGRDRVMPALGFDQFLDRSAFSDADYCGQYISDQAVGDAITALLEASDQPVFVFAITMENHGPLHLEKADPSRVQQQYTRPPDGPLNDLSVYLHHLSNADRMLRQVTSALQNRDRGGSLCWYGDHVPIMADVYRHLGEPDASTPWLIWSTGTAGHREHSDMDKNSTSGNTACQPPMPAHALARQWLKTVKSGFRI